MKMNDKTIDAWIDACKEMYEIIKELQFCVEDKNGDAVICPQCGQRLTHSGNCIISKIIKKVEEK